MRSRPGAVIAVGVPFLTVLLIIAAVAAGSHPARCREPACRPGPPPVIIWVPAPHPPAPYHPVIEPAGGDE